MKSKSRIWEICFGASQPLDGRWEEHDRESQAREWNRTGDEWSYCSRFSLPPFPEYELLYHDKRQDRCKWHIYILPSKRNLTQSGWKQLRIRVSHRVLHQGEKAVTQRYGDMQCLFGYIMKNAVGWDLNALFMSRLPHVTLICSFMFSIKFSFKQ